MKSEQERDTGELFLFLQTIQGTIDRMATSSAIFKGFTATIATSISAISFSEVNRWMLLLSFIPVLSFLLLDVYYLRLERRYRFLYDWIRTKRKELDYDLRPPKVKEILETDSNANVRIWDCIKSPSIGFFYFPIITISIIVIIMNFGGCLK